MWVSMARPNPPPAQPALALQANFQSGGGTPNAYTTWYAGFNDANPGPTTLPGSVRLSAYGDHRPGYGAGHGPGILAATERSGLADAAQLHRRRAVPGLQETELFPSPFARSPHRPAAGFSLVEIMVGMVIGMLGLIIMMQVFSLSESQKRTTTGGGDAHSNGAIALFGLQRDLRQAGFGVSDPNAARLQRRAARRGDFKRVCAGHDQPCRHSRRRSQHRHAAADLQPHQGLAAGRPHPNATDNGTGGPGV